VPLLARVYPNGSADVNQFQAAGGPGFVLRELLDSGLLHPTWPRWTRAACAAHTREPGAPTARLRWHDAAGAPAATTTVLRPASRPFSAQPAA
jgi:phosphogluconate dehydratase